MKKRKELPSDFRLNKWNWTLGILGLGMGAALLWSFWASVVLGQGYPESYVLGPPAFRFSDFTDEAFASTLSNPYDDPISVYPLSAFVLFRALSYYETPSLIFIVFVSVTATALLLVRVLRPILAEAWVRVFMAYLFLALSYPLLFCIDRGNIDIVLVPLIAWAIYFYSLHRDWEGTACLFPAICLKLYPAFLLVLLLRRRKASMAILCGIGAIAVNAACCLFYPESSEVLWNSYKQNTQFFTDYNFLQNVTLEGSASPWNAYKITVVALQEVGIMPPVNFSFDGPFILASYQVYLMVLALIALFSAVYAWLLEPRQTRGMIMLLLYITISVPSGPDYRLNFAAMGIILLVLQPEQRRGDLIALILIALAVIPKKEILLTFVGKTETNYTDVPIQALLDPIFILAAMGILAFQSRHFFNLRVVAWRFRDLLPWRWRWI